MRAAVERDDPRLVDHLVEDDDVAARLDDLQVVVVRARNHRRPGVEAENAAVHEAEILGIVEAPGARRPLAAARAPP